jgi:pimeloyl-ACP methyl ester carboxylesterase
MNQVLSNNGAAMNIQEILKVMLSFRLFFPFIFMVVTVFGCARPFKYPYTVDYPGAYLHPIAVPSVVDGRERFREIFCGLLAEDPEYRDEAGHCEDFLLRLSDEGPLDTNPGPLPGGNTRYRILVVPGLFNECFVGTGLPFETSIEALRNRGIRIERIVVSGHSSCDQNAAYIAEFVRNMNLATNEALVLVGHSKGAVDILHFLVDHPEQCRRVAAVVSVAGAINGSPMGKEIVGIYTRLGRDVPANQCNPKDSDAVDSLDGSIRLSWLAANPLPDSVEYFSMVAFTPRENVNALMRAGYDTLAIRSPRNDGILLSTDQIIPGATLLGYANADNWSVALPLEDSHLSDTIRMPKRFPRETLLESILAYVAECLDQKKEENETAVLPN